MPNTPYKLTTAPNGLRVMLVPRAGTEAVTVEYFFKAGSRYESPEINGLAHFTEHMVFKGAKHYPTFASVNTAINQVGGYFNAYTSGEVTAFYVKAAADKAEVALDVLSDILTEPHYETAELDKERGVILEEINMYEDNPQGQLQLLLEATGYPDHPLGRSTLGPKKNISSFPRKAFVDYTAEYLTPDRALLVVAGNVDHVNEKLLEKYNSRFSGSSDTTAPPAPTEFAPRKVKVKKRQTEQTHLGLSLYAPPLTDRAASFQLDVLSMILGGNSSSRLFSEVREQQGLAYYVFSTPDQMIDTGTLNVYAGVTNEKAGQALGSIITQLKHMRDGDFTSKELSIAKESLKGMRALRWEDSSSLGTLYGLQQLILGEVDTPAEIFTAFEAVTKDQVTQLAGELVTDAKLSVAAVGPQEQEKLHKIATVA